MDRHDIETKIHQVQRMLAAERDTSTLATLNSCLEKLTLMDADDDDPPDCETCGGDGRIRVHNYQKIGGGKFERPRIVDEHIMLDCDDCGGTGKINHERKADQ